MPRNAYFRKVLVAAAAASTVLAFAACGRGSDSSQSGARTGGSGAKVAAVIKGLDNPFFQTMEKGIKDQAAQTGTDVEVQAAQSITDTTGQSDKLVAMAQQDFDCFVVNPISGTNLVQGLAQVARKKVPIVNIDSPVDPAAAKEAGVTLATYIGTDNTSAGELAGERMVKQVPSGKIAVIGGIAGDVTSGARIDGFTKAVSSGSSLTLLPVQAADWDRQKALTAATDILNAHPDVKGFFAANDDMGLGIARAVANAGKTGRIAVISVDGNQDAIKAVQSGDLDATVAQYPYAIGQLGVQACQAAAAGKTLPTDVKAPVALVTKDVAADALAKFPAPFQAFDNPLAALVSGQ